MKTNVKQKRIGRQGGIVRFFAKYGEDYLFILPYMLIFTVFTVVAVLVSFGLSFTQFDVIRPPVFTGFNNYIRLFMDDALFPVALKNTLILSLITGPAGFLLSLLVAWMLNELGNGLRSLLTLFFYAPVISGGAFLFWQIIYSGDSYGLLNGLLLGLGITRSPIQWLTDTRYMMGTAIVVILWMSFGTGFLSFIAGFKNMDTRLYEAGAIDGIKNRYQELWFITLPSMRQQLMFGAVMSITGSFGMGGVITSLYGFPSTNYALHTLTHLMEDYGGIRFEMGYASAISTVLFLIMMFSNLAVNKLLTKVGS